MGGIAALAGPYLAEAGFSGAWWRQVGETINGHLIRTFGLHFPGARTKRGLLTRLAAKLLAVNVGLWLNLLIFGRPLGPLPPSSPANNSHHTSTEGSGTYPLLGGLS